MANRVTVAEVKEIIETVASDAAIGAHITAANLIVTRNLAGSDLGDDTLKEIERWLAAHFVAVQDMRKKSESIGDSSETNMGNAGMGLDFTPYGQQVKLLDATGTLATIGQKRAFFEVL